MWISGCPQGALGRIPSSPDTPPHAQLMRDDTFLMFGAWSGEQSPGRVRAVPSTISPLLVGDSEAIGQKLVPGEVVQAALGAQWVPCRGWGWMLSDGPQQNSSRHLGRFTGADACHLSLGLSFYTQL